MKMKILTRFLKNDDGAELAEYAVAVALLVAIAIVAYAKLGNSILDTNNGTAASVDSASDWTFTPN